MIKDFSHVDIASLTASEKDKMQRGLCPKCGHDTFKREVNLLTPSSAFLNCVKCSYLSSEHLFQPVNVI